MKSNKRHYLTVDVEDWFQVFFAEHRVPKSKWDMMEPRIHNMIDETLELFSRYNVHATFFFVGWLGDKYPKLVKRVSDCGHEIASHSYWHREAHTISISEFKEDINRAKEVLEDAAQRVVLGFRAPGYSIRLDDTEQIHAIAEAGYVYDSSVLQSSTTPFFIGKDLLEVPPNGLRFGNRFEPSNGGFFFRLLPYCLFKRYVRRLERRNETLNFYVHSWEVHTKYPRLQLGLRRNLIQYANLEAVVIKLHKLLQGHEFTSIERGVAG
ncbi:MAG: hypothetical protein CL484_03775 [Acidobacteria bacterium]|nr:hypothetical protein [Acidobacteriota bacterium]|tara:strand:+ start:56 stop:853 length:798 start_codon:yes stop_codon:yes gene_type:complete